MQEKTQPCPTCGTEMRFEQHPNELSYKGQTLMLDTLAWWCPECGEGILSGEQLLAQQKAFTEFKAELDGVLSPSQVAEVRKKLGLSQRRASALLGGGPWAFQRYESGSVSVSVAMSHLLVLLGNDPKRLEEISTPGFMEDSDETRD